MLLFVLSINLSSQEKTAFTHPSSDFANSMDVDMKMLRVNNKTRAQLRAMIIAYSKAFGQLNKHENSQAFYHRERVLKTLSMGLQSLNAHLVLRNYPWPKEYLSESELAIFNQLQMSSSSRFEWKIINEYIQRAIVGNNDNQRYAWMLSNCLCHVNAVLHIEQQTDVLLLFAEVNDKVHGMSWETGKNKLFIPSIITAVNKPGSVLKPGEQLLNLGQYDSINKKNLLSNSTIRSLATTIDDKGEAKVFEKKSLSKFLRETATETPLSNSAFH